MDKRDMLRQGGNFESGMELGEKLLGKNREYLK